MKVAIVYDRVNKWGGAERVLLALHKIFPDAHLFTSVYNRATAPWADVFRIHTSFLQYIPFAKTNHEVLAPLMPLAFESFSFTDYDLVISVTSESAKGIITTQKTKHICYLLTPTRYLWSGYDEYFHNSFFRFLTFPLVWYLRFWDRFAAQRPDTIISISEEVKKRVKKYYGRDSHVIYPPLTLKNTSTKTTLKEKDFFLVVSRLVSYKKVDLAVKACTNLKLPLKIIGSGSQEQQLRHIAGPTVQFLGSLTDHDMVEYYKNCKALIFPSIDDFGLTVLEAQQFGKPVIAVKKGGVLETIQEGKTGEFFFPQNHQALEKVLSNFDSTKYKAEDCKNQAKKFTEDHFEKELKKVISEYIKI